MQPHGTVGSGAGNDSKSSAIFGIVKAPRDGVSVYGTVWLDEPSVVKHVHRSHLKLVPTTVIPGDVG